MRHLSPLYLVLPVSLFFVGCGTKALPGQPISEETSVPEAQNASSSAPISETTVVAKNLRIPWGVAFLPEGDMLVTERTGNLLRIGSNGEKTEIEGAPDSRALGEGGLLGLVLHPDFKNNHQLYIYSSSGSLGSTSCMVERYRLDGNRLVDRTSIIQGIPGSIYHDGGRMAFGPDGKLYITTGDAGNSDNAQDKNSLSGKILRVNDDGSLPSDNPFGNAVWSYGHRNPQGITWDDTGRLWETEHGRSGVLSGYDELNLIEQGKNYGWPVIQGPEKKDGMESPQLQSGPSTTWAPASAVYHNGSIFFGGLKGERVYEAVITGEKPVLQEHFVNQFGRIRTVVLGPDGSFYLTTSNTDGRGNPKADDDKIIKLDPSIISSKARDLP